MTDPVETTDLASFTINLAYELGKYHERERLATNIIELTVNWREPAVIAYLDRIRDRISEMEKYAATNPAATWRGHYPGGPVDWETGQLTEASP